MPTFDDVQCRFFSQNGEDGTIWYLLSLIGDGAKRVVEICSGDGVECCSANLIVNHGWQALLFEGNPDLVDRGRQFYEHCGDAWFSPPRFVNTSVTPDNVNAHLAEHGFGSDIDVVIIDMDGNDYWMWEALALDPRLVVVEFNQALGTPALNCDSLSPRFSMARRFGIPQCFSAGIRRNRERLGYRLVGTERYCFNAFFLRNDCAADLIPEVSVESCMNHPKLQRLRQGVAQRSCGQMAGGVAGQGPCGKHDAVEGMPPLPADSG